MSQVMAAETPPRIRTFARLAWAGVWRAAKRAPVLLIASWLAVAAAMIAAPIAASALAKIETSGWLLDTGVTVAGWLAGLARMALVSLALAPVAIAVIRYVILQEAPAFAFGGRRVWRFAAWLFGFQLFNAASGLPAMIYGPQGTFALAAVVLVTTGVISLRSALVFPELATVGAAGTIKDHIERSWERTAGIFWRTFIALVLAELPFFILNGLIGAAATRAAAKASTAAFQPISLVTGVVSAAVVVLSVALGAALISWAYLWALDRERAGA